MSLAQHLIEHAILGVEPAPGVEIVTASATVALTAASGVYQLIDPNGAARDVTLPAFTTGDAGRAFSIKNTGTGGFNLTVKNASAVQVGPVVGNGYTLAVLWSGTSWEAL